MRSQMVVSFLFLLLAMPAVADQVALKNGDRLTGSISKSDGKELVIKTDYAGDVTVKFDAIQGITSAGDLHVVLGDGKTVVGPVSTSGDNVVVASRTAGTVEAPKSSIKTLHSPAEEAAHEKSLHPGWGEGWNGGLNLGFALTRGNSASKNLNIAFTATRKGFEDKLILYSNTIYATNDQKGATPSTTANVISGIAPHHRERDRRRCALRPRFRAAPFRVREWGLLSRRTAGLGSAHDFWRGHWIPRHQERRDYFRPSRGCELHPRKLFRAV